MHPKNNNRKIVHGKVTTVQRARFLWIFLILLLLLGVESASGLTPKPTKKPTLRPTAKPTKRPTAKPTAKPTLKPTSKATVKAGYCSTAAAAWARSGICTQLEGYIQNATSSFVMGIIGGCSQTAFAQAVVAVAGASNWVAHSCNSAVPMRALNCSYLSYIANLTVFVPSFMSQCNSPTGPTKTIFFKYSGTIQTFTVPRNISSLTISVAGAQGGSYNYGSGGYGAVLTGTFSVSTGQVLRILVGETPVSTTYAGGGGGTFVAQGASLSSAVPLIIAGGGGGAAGSQNTGQGGQVSTFGGGPFPGMNGYGAPSTLCGGGGGGFFSSGGNDTMYPLQGGGGSGFRQGGAGGRSLQYSHGGFGGGATPDYLGSCNSEGGAGGGYSGGSGQNTLGLVYAGFGGGSYNSGTAKRNIAASWSGNGLASVSYTPGSSWKTCSAVYTAWLKSGACPKLFKIVDAALSSFDESMLCSQQKFNNSVITAAGGWSEWGACATASVVSPFLNCMYTSMTTVAVQAAWNQSYMEFYATYCTPGIVITGLSSNITAPGAPITLYWISTVTGDVYIYLYTTSGDYISEYEIAANSLSYTYNIPSWVTAGTYKFFVYYSTNNRWLFAESDSFSISTDDYISLCSAYSCQYYSAGLFSYCLGGMSVIGNDGAVSLHVPHGFTVSLYNDCSYNGPYGLTKTFNSSSTSLPSPFYLAVSGLYVVKTTKGITVTWFPAPGATYSAGSYVDLHWRTSLGGYVVIYLYSSSGVYTASSSWILADSLYSSFYIPTTVRAGTYAFQIYSITDWSIYGQSDSFSVSNPAGAGSITVTGLSSYTVAAGSYMYVYWNSLLVDSVDILLYSSSGIWASGVYGISASTAYNMFYIPMQSVAGTYYFLMYSSTDYSISGQSEYFSVTQSSGSSIIVTGLSEYSVAEGGSVTVYWSTTLSGYFDIYLYSNWGYYISSSSWIPADTLSCLFTIPTYVSVGTYYFSIHSNSDWSTHGESGYFSVTPSINFTQITWAMDCLGNDLVANTGFSTPTDCASWCETVSGCAGFVIGSTPYGACWLKSAVIPGGYNTGVNCYKMSSVGKGITVTGLSGDTVAVGSSITVYWNTSISGDVGIYLFNISGGSVASSWIPAYVQQNAFYIPASVRPGIYFFWIESETNSNIHAQSGNFSITAPATSLSVAYNGSFYVYYSTLRSWTDAESQCKADGAHLVKINNEAENAVVLSLIKTNSWMGANDIETLFSFFWISDGSAVSYSNWGACEPNNGWGGAPQRCVQLVSTSGAYTTGCGISPGQWDDDQCANLKSFVCERPACPMGCRTCSGPTSCTSCNAGLFLQKGNCVCPKGMHASSQGCTGCAENCASCTSAKECTSCAAGYYLHKNKCKACHKGCKSCDSSTNCFTCESGLYLSQGNCGSFCPDGTYGQSGVCTACLDECATCKDDFSCTSCYPGFFHSKDKCYACPLGCSVCHSLKSCLSCQPGFFLTHKQCIASSVSGDEVAFLRGIRGGY